MIHFRQASLGMFTMGIHDSRTEIGRSNSLGLLAWFLALAGLGKRAALHSRFVAICTVGWGLGLGHRLGRIKAYCLSSRSSSSSVVVVVVVVVEGL